MKHFKLFIGGGKLFLIFTLILCNNFIFAQQGVKWSVGGNNINTGDFFGTTNMQGIEFRTNGITRMNLHDNGEFHILDKVVLKPFAGTQYGGIVSYIVDGVLTGIKFTGNSNDVLQGDGTFGSSLINQYWKLNGDIMYNMNSGFVGIGTSNPQATLDVDGNSIIRGTLFVYNGIIVGTRYEGEKAEVDTIKTKEMEVTENFKVQTINIDGINSKITSTTGLVDFANTNLKTTGSIYTGTLTTNNLNVGNATFNSLMVNGNIQASGIIKSGNSIWLDGSNHSVVTDENIMDLKVSTNNKVMTLTNDKRVGIGTENPVCNLDVYDDHAEIKAGNDVNYLRMGYNTANAMIDNFGNGKLHINYYSGKDVVVGSETGTGSFNVKHDSYLASVSGNVGIGTTDPTALLDIATEGSPVLNLRTTSSYLSSETATINLVGTQQGGIIGEINFINNDEQSNSEPDAYIKAYNYAAPDVARIIIGTSDDSGGAITGFALSGNGNVGIGTESPEAALDVRSEETIIARFSNNNAGGKIEFQGGAEQAIIRNINSGHLEFGTFQGTNYNDNQIFLNSNGNVGIGTNTPYEAFQIGDDWTFHQNGTYAIARNFKYESSQSIRINSDEASIIKFDDNGDIQLQTGIYGGAGTPISWIPGICLSNAGNVGIGTGSPNSLYKLDVRGSAHFCKAVVKYDGWCDYVFNDNYELIGLDSLETFVKANKHLPDIPTETEVMENGIDLGEMNTKLLKKVEELTLYIIEQEKRIRKLEENSIGYNIDGNNKY